MKITLGTVTALMISAWMLAVLYSPAPADAADDWDQPIGPSHNDGGGKKSTPKGSVDKSSNGKPAAGKLDDAAVAKLTALEEKLAKEDGKEKEVIDGALPLVKTFENNEDNDHLVDCVFLLGEAYYHLGDWTNAQAQMQRAADLGFRYYATEMSTYPLKVIGDCQFELGKQDEALATYKDRVQRLRKNDPEAELAGALFDVGSLQINTGKYDDALASLSEAKQANEARAKQLAAAGTKANPDDVEGCRVDQAEIIYHLGIANFHKSNLPEARTWLEKALETFKGLDQKAQDDFRDRMVAVLDDLVQVCTSLNDTAAAADYQKQRDALNH